MEWKTEQHTNMPTLAIWRLLLGSLMLRLSSEFLPDRAVLNDMPNVVGSSEVNLYADDTTLYHSSKCLTDLKRSVETDAESVSKWIDENGLLMNSSKTQSMFLNRRKLEDEVAEARLVLRGTEVANGSRVKYSV